MYDDHDVYGYDCWYDDHGDHGDDAYHGDDHYDDHGDDAYHGDDHYGDDHDVDFVVMFMGNDVDDSVMLAIAIMEVNVMI